MNTLFFLHFTIFFKTPKLLFIQFSRFSLRLLFSRMTSVKGGTRATEDDFLFFTFVFHRNLAYNVFLEWPPAVCFSLVGLLLRWWTHPNLTSRFFARKIWRCNFALFFYFFESGFFEISLFSHYFPILPCGHQDRYLSDLPGRDDDSSLFEWFSLILFFVVFCLFCLIRSNLSLVSLIIWTCRTVIMIYISIMSVVGPFR